MRNRAGSACLKVEASAIERQDRRPLGSASDVFLTLPTVSPKIPSESTSNVNVRRWADIALLLLDLVDEQEILASAYCDPRSVIDDVLVKWVSKHCGDIHLLGGFHLVSTLQVSDQNVYSYDDSDATVATKKVWHLGLVSAEDANVVSVKAKVKSLEAKFPGLGYAAVSHAELASYRTISMFSPNTAFGYAQCVYWYGTDNDEDFLSERDSYNAEGEISPEEEGDELIKPSDFIQSFGEFFAPRERMQKEQLEVISASQDIEAAEVAHILLNIDRLIEEGAELPNLCDRDVEQAYFSCLMRWDEEDVLMRCHDDFINMANQCSDGYTDLIGVADVPYDRKAFQKWRAKMEKGFELYSQLDHLMQRIGTVIHD